MCFFTPRRPGYCPFEGFCGIVVCCRIFNTLVEGHNNISSQLILNLNGNFRRQPKRFVVFLMFKRHTFVIYFFPGQRKNLKSTGICQNRTVPAHETMQSAQLLHQISPWLVLQMIGVGKHDLGTCLFQLHHCHRFHSGGSSHRHKNGGFYLTMGCEKTSPASPGRVIPQQIE